MNHSTLARCRPCARARWRRFASPLSTFTWSSSTIVSGMGSPGLAGLDARGAVKVSSKRYSLALVVHDVGSQRLLFLSRVLPLTVLDRALGAFASLTALDLPGCWPCAPTNGDAQAVAVAALADDQYGASRVPGASPHRHVHGVHPSPGSAALRELAIVDAVERTLLTFWSRSLLRKTVAVDLFSVLAGVQPQIVRVIAAMSCCALISNNRRAARA
jgi:hypothetical protein